MKISSALILFCIPVFFFGCETTPLIVSPSAVNIVVAYAPVKITIMPLTEFNLKADPPHIRVYVSLSDSFDIRKPAKNNRYWQDFLRAYEFKLDLDFDIADRNYILEVTCHCPTGRRLSDEFTLRLAD